MNVAVSPKRKPCAGFVSAERGRSDIRHLIIDATNAHPTEANGVHNTARSLVREHTAAGKLAQLFLLAPVPPSAPADPLCPTVFVPLEGLVLRNRTVRLRQRVIDALLVDSSRNTIFHIHGGREPLLAGLGKALRRRGVPYVVTVHGRFSHVYDTTGRCLHRLTEAYLKLFERPLLEGARFVQALSSLEARIVRRVAPAARVEEVSNGAYSSQLEPAPPVPPQRPPSAAFPHFMFCGRYAIHHKGLDLMLQGLALYRQAGGRGFLTTIGTGAERDEVISRAAALGVSDAVRIGGPLFGAARDTALQQGDFFIMASRYEGVPLAALEAALLGLPLMVTPATGLDGIVSAHDAGIPIDDVTADAVAQAMHRAEQLSPVEWAACSTASHALACEAADWTRIARHLLDLYAETPGRQRTPTSRPPAL